MKLHLAAMVGCVLMVLGNIRAVSGATYVVDGSSAMASDTNPGTAALPLKTIGKAADLAGPGDTVLIRPGVYAETVALTKSGTPENPITFRAERPGTVVLSGADPLAGWTREPGDRAIYSTAWPYDFIINTNPDGSKVRNHMAPPPVGNAEEFVWQGRPLQEVMRPDQVQPGQFYVDWEKRRVSTWLPGDADPNRSMVLGSSRSLLFSPRNQWNQWSKAEYITVKGLVFRYAANFAQRAPVVASTGWRMEDCTVEWANGPGLGVMGHDVTLERVTVQDNGEAGMGGSDLKNVTIRDCTLRRNNWKGFSPGNEGGACKFVTSDGVQVIHCASYDNVGPGW